MYKVIIYTKLCMIILINTYENEEELVEKGEGKTWRINKISLTNEDIDEEVKDRRLLELLKE